MRQLTQGCFIRRDERQVVVIVREPADAEPKMLVREYRCDTVSERVELRGAAWDGSEVPAERGGAVDCTGASGRLTRRYYYRGTAHAIEVSIVGDEQAVRVDAVPIPPPRTGLQTRWERGRWQKLHATHGWIDAVPRRMNERTS